MKTGRIYLIVFSSTMFFFTLVFIASQVGFFRSMEQAGVNAPSLSKFQSQLLTIHQAIKAAKTVDEFKQAFRGFDENKSLSGNHQGMEKIKVNYAGLMTLYGNRSKDSEEKFLMAKKRDLMEGLVNSYRKEIPHGDLRVRAAYLNILFDTQNSLLNEGDSAEGLYLTKTKEKFSNLKQLVAGMRDGGLHIRVANLESSFFSYERAFDSLLKWKTSRQEALIKAEKALPKIAQDVYAEGDTSVGSAKYLFAIVCFLGLALLVFSALALLVTHRVLSNRFQQRIEAVRKCFLSFGREVKEKNLDAAIAYLEKDEEWRSIVSTMKKAEAELLSEYQTLFAMARSLKVPYLIFDRKGSAKIWNEAAASLFHLVPEKDYKLSDLINATFIGAHEGEEKIVIDTIANSFGAPTEDVFEIIIKTSQGTVPAELICNAVTSGPLTGGKVYLFRTIKNEVQRIQKKVDSQISKVREVAHAITYFLPLPQEALRSENAMVNETLGDLSQIKFKQEERELLWKNENQALLDQVNRQKEVLLRLNSDIATIQKNNSELKNALQAIQSFDETLTAEIDSVNRDLDTMVSSQEKVVQGLRRRDSLLEQAMQYEQVTRKVHGQLVALVKNHQNEFNELNSFVESAKLLAVNLSLGQKSKESADFAMRTRAFVGEIEKFCKESEQVFTGIEQFIASFPSASLYPVVASDRMDAGDLEIYHSSQTKFSEVLQRWKSMSEQVVAQGDHALEIAQEQEIKGNTAFQLGETSLLINDQAKGNLQRWN